jgi:hypothetical protein
MSNAQRFVDLVSVYNQSFQAPFPDTSSNALRGTDRFYNLFIPVVLNPKATLICRINAEDLAVQNMTNTRRIHVFNTAFPLGMQWTQGSWKFTGLVIPKVAGQDWRHTQSNQWQCGAYGLVTKEWSEKVKVKLGLYYNKEAFGNFFVPLVGVDVKFNDQWECYGVLPNNFRLSRSNQSHTLFTGLGFKSFTRSFVLNQDFVGSYLRYNEVQVKLFTEYYSSSKVLFSLELGYSLGKTPGLFDQQSQDRLSESWIAPQRGFPLFNLGIAYRLYP